MFLAEFGKSIFEIGGDIEDMEACKTAITALQEKAERDKGCEYCNSRFGIATHHINNSGSQAGTNKIADYCPKCGRKLGENNG